MKIDSSIPIPDRVSYPFALMRKGDSVAEETERTASIKSAASRYKREHPGWDYRTKIEGDQIRLWCVAVPVRSKAITGNRLKN